MHIQCTSITFFLKNTKLRTNKYIISRSNKYNYVCIIDENTFPTPDSNILLESILALKDLQTLAINLNELVKLVRFCSSL